MNLYVSNLSAETTEKKLEELFLQFGEVATTKIILDVATGTSKGFGFIDMYDNLEAQDAIDNLDGTFLQGSIISVKEAKQKNKPLPNSSSPRFGQNPGNRTSRPRIPRSGNRFI